MIRNVQTRNVVAVNMQSFVFLKIANFCNRHRRLYIVFTLGKRPSRVRGGGGGFLKRYEKAKIYEDSTFE